MIGPGYRVCESCGRVAGRYAPCEQCENESYSSVILVGATALLAVCAAILYMALS